MYKGQSKVKQKGQKGEKEVTKEIVFINDEEKSSEVTLEKTVKEPVDKIVVKGSKKRVYATPSYNGGSSSSVVSLAIDKLITVFHMFMEEQAPQVLTAQV